MKALLAVATILALSGCASNYKVKQESSEANVLTQVPAWFIEEQKRTTGLIIKRRNEYIYGVGSAVSASLQIAIDKATMQAKADLGDQIRSSVNKTTEYAAQESGSETSASLVTETASTTVNTITDINVTGYQEWKKAVFVTASQQYRVYVGLKWTRGDDNVLNDLIPLDLISRVSEDVVETVNIAESP